VTRERREGEGDSSESPKEARRGSRRDKHRQDGLPPTRECAFKEKALLAGSCTGAARSFVKKKKGRRKKRSAWQRSGKTHRSSVTAAIKSSWKKTKKKKEVVLTGEARRTKRFYKKGKKGRAAVRRNEITSSESSKKIARSREKKAGQREAAGRRGPFPPCGGKKCRWLIPMETEIWRFISLCVRRKKGKDLGRKNC